MSNIENKKNSKRSAKEWEEEVNRWRASGLPMEAYCRQHELTSHRLGYYKRKQDAIKEVETASFAQVSLEPSPASEGLNLRLPSGHIIDGISKDNLAVVSALVGALS